MMQLTIIIPILMSMSINITCMNRDRKSILYPYVVSSIRTITDANQDKAGE